MVPFEFVVDNLCDFLLPYPRFHHKNLEGEMSQNIEKTIHEASEHIVEMRDLSEAFGLAADFAVNGKQSLESAATCLFFAAETLEAIVSDVQELAEGLDQKAFDIERGRLKANLKKTETDLAAIKAASEKPALPSQVIMDLYDAARQFQQFIAGFPDNDPVLWYPDKSKKVVDLPHYQDACAALTRFDLHVHGKAIGAL